jgi:predicted secreted protein
MTPVSPHVTPPRLRTGESTHLVSFWPSPTPRARRERQRGASGVRWWVGRARFCVQEEGYFSPCKMTPVSPHLTPPRLRTGESTHLVSFWPSPTPRARRERQRGASGTRLWVGRARFCVQEEGYFFPCKMTPVSPHLTPPRLRTGESTHLVSFWPSPTPRARRERRRRASGTRLWVGRARFCVCLGGVLFPV